MNKKERSIYNKKYYQNHKTAIKNKNKKYYQNHKDSLKKYHKEYRKQNANKINLSKKNWYKKNKEHDRKYKRNYMKKYYSTKNGRKKIMRAILKRKKNYNWIPLFENPFPNELDIEYHHINDLFVIPIPKNIHKKCYAYLLDEHRERCNLWLYYLYGIDFNILLDK